jgi:uncharacterized membrane protein
VTLLKVSWPSPTTAEGYSLGFIDEFGFIFRAFCHLFNELWRCLKFIVAGALKIAEKSQQSVRSDLTLHLLFGAEKLLDRNRTEETFSNPTVYTFFVCIKLSSRPCFRLR